MNQNNNPILKPHAQKLRRNMTKEERHLWYDFLKLLPVTVKRQMVFGTYIVDFYIASAKVAIELDGHSIMKKRVLLQTGNGISFYLNREYGFCDFRIMM